MKTRTKALITITATLSALALFIYTRGPRNGTERQTSSTVTVRFEIQGHRGARAVRPENSLSAFRYALEAGVDTLEMDLHATKDNVLVVTHDPFLNSAVCVNEHGQTIASNLKIRNLTLAQLKTYDCGSKINPRFPKQIPQPGERIATFEEVLTWLQNSTDPRSKTVLLNVETKSEAAHPDYTPDPATFTQMLIDTARQFSITPRLTIQSFDFRTLIEAKRIEPSISTSALIDGRPRESLTSLARRLKVNIISPNYTWLKRSDVIALQGEGVRVIPWTVNDLAHWKQMYELGVDGIISDDPKPLIEFRTSIE